MTPANYIAHIDSRLRQEEGRCDRFFERQSKKDVMEVVQQQIISRVSQDLVNKGFDNLVKLDDAESLRTLYRLLNLVKEVEIIRTTWSSYIKVIPSNLLK
jgi:cullin-4